MGLKNKENFQYHFKLESSKNRCPCGPGSDTEFVKQCGTIDFIDGIIKKYDVKSINDCACGLFGNWAKLIDLSGVSYTGYDINNLAIEQNKRHYPDIPFHEFDLVNNVVPKVDLIICRDCLFHLSNRFVSSIIDNFKKSGSTYLLATDHRNLKRNTELTPKELRNEAGFKLVNLEIEPFNLGLPIEIHNEDVVKFLKIGNNRQMSLWRLN